MASKNYSNGPSKVQQSDLVQDVWNNPINFSFLLMAIFSMARHLATWKITTPVFCGHYLDFVTPCCESREQGQDEEGKRQQYSAK